MYKVWYLSLVLIFICSSVYAKEYYFRLDTGKVIVIVTSDDILLSEALVSGEFESSFTDSYPESTPIESISAESDFLSELLSLHTPELEEHISEPQNTNVIELINICSQPAIGEETFKYKCAIPSCKRKFKFGSHGGTAKKTKHHKTHFKPEFLESLNGQQVVCPYCYSSIAGILNAIIIHFSRYCPASGEK